MIYPAYESAVRSLTRKIEKAYPGSILDNYSTDSIDLDDLELMKFAGNEKAIRAHEKNLKRHLDHRVSIRAGYLGLLPTWLIACPLNLEYLSGMDNSSKSERSSISVIELLGSFQKWEGRQDYLKRYKKGL
jgi:hypothetical protein